MSSAVNGAIEVGLIILLIGSVIVEVRDHEDAAHIARGVDRPSYKGTFGPPRRKVSVYTLGGYPGGG